MPWPHWEDGTMLVALGMAPTVLLWSVFFPALKGLRELAGEEPPRLAAERGPVPFERALSKWIYRHMYSHVRVRDYGP